MKVAFVACEYNPFHNGHLHHLIKTKESGADAVVCIMSGNFVQRGDAAICEKHIRAKTALLNGADLVIELPLKYAVAPASLFADGFVKTAAATGLSGFLSFGAKDSLENLLQLIRVLFSEEAESFAKEQLKYGINYPNAKSLFIRETLGDEFADKLLDANNTLALEYIHSASVNFPEAGFFAVKRDKILHNSDIAIGNITSAGYLRDKLYASFINAQNDFIHNIRCYVPESVYYCLLEEYSAGRFPTDSEKFETAALSRLITLSAEDFRLINNVSEGLENRIVEAVKQSYMLSEMLDSVKTKRFTYSRIRQILLNAVLGISREDINRGISYIRVLGFNSNGRKLLHIMKETAVLPVIMNLSEIDKNNPSAARDALLDYNAGKLFGLCNPVISGGNPEYEIPPYYYN